MHVSDAYAWLLQSERRVRFLLNWDQPLTSKQLARRLGMGLDACRKVIRELAVYRLVRCLNPTARSSRVYDLTLLGTACQRKACGEMDHPVPPHFVPKIDWPLYGWVCFRHRGAILKALVKPMSPAEIKRWARGRDPNLRMSANNVRDVIRLFRERGIVEPIHERRKARPRYQLTETGVPLRDLLCRAEQGIWARPTRNRSKSPSRTAWSQTVPHQSHSP